MNLGGYADRIARVDLTSGKVAYEHIDESDARKYVGARGLGVKYVFDNGPGVDPLAPDNLLCFMNGPLTGSEVTMSGRMAIVTGPGGESAGAVHCRSTLNQSVLATARFVTALGAALAW